MKYYKFLKMARKWVFPLVVVLILLILILFIRYSYTNNTKEGLGCPSNPKFHYKKFTFNQRGSILSNKKIDDKYKTAVKKLTIFINQQSNKNEFKRDDTIYQITKDGNFVKIIFKTPLSEKYLSLNENQILECSPQEQEQQEQQEEPAPPPPNSPVISNEKPVPSESVLEIKPDMLKTIFDSKKTTDKSLIDSNRFVNLDGLTDSALNNDFYQVYQANFEDKRKNEQSPMMNKNDLFSIINELYKKNGILESIINTGQSYYIVISPNNKSPPGYSNSRTNHVVSTFKITNESPPNNLPTDKTIIEGDNTIYIGSNYTSFQTIFNVIFYNMRDLFSIKIPQMYSLGRIVAKLDTENSIYMYVAPPQAEDSASKEIASPPPLGPVTVTTGTQAYKR